MKMKRRTFLAAAPLLPHALQAQSETGFTSLFDGSSLRGWSIQEGPESAFYVRDGAIVVHEGSNFPTWLRHDRQFENFDLRLEFFLKGWMDSDLYLHAPEHGRNTWAGMAIKLFHAKEEPKPESMGAIFPLIAPKSVPVKNQGEWNALRVLMDWPALQVWLNGEQVQDVNVESVPELRYRLRRGYIGFESLSYPIRFRNVRIRELPSKDTWESLYEQESDFSKWTVAEGKAKFETLGPVLRGDGLGHLATREQFRDFHLQLYIRASKHSNGGVLFRAGKDALKDRHYEIQIHDVENAHYPTGSLYHFRRATYPRIEPEKWYLMQLFVEGKRCVVRVNGDTVVDYDNLQDLQAGQIMLQAHQAGKWIEYKQIRIKRL